MRRTVLKFTYQSQLEKKYTENLGDMADEDLFGTDTDKRKATLEVINSACRKIAALTTNTYLDAQIITEMSVDEELAGLEE